MKAHLLVLSVLFVGSTAFARDHYTFRVDVGGNEAGRAGMCRDVVESVQDRVHEAEVKLGLAEGMLMADGEYQRSVQCDNHRDRYGRPDRYGRYHPRRRPAGYGPRGVARCTVTYDCMVYLRAKSEAMVRFDDFKTTARMGEGRMQECVDDRTAAEKERAVVYSEMRDYRRVLGMFGKRRCSTHGVEVLKK